MILTLNPKYLSRGAAGALLDGHAAIRGVRATGRDRHAELREGFHGQLEGFASRLLHPRLLVGELGAALFIIFNTRLIIFDIRFIVFVTRFIFF